MRAITQTDVLLIKVSNYGQARKTMDVIHQAGGEVLAMVPHTESLEDYFMREVEGR